jgi:hypothetical protein
MSERLSIKEQGRLIELETVISQNLHTAIRCTTETGRALLEIRDSRLYRSQAKTFEEFCESKWGLKCRQAYRIMEFCEVRESLCPIGHKLPDKEIQTRALGNVPEGDRQTVWERAVNDAGGRQPTGEEIERAARVHTIARKVLASMPAEKQKEVLEGKNKEILDRAKVRRKQDEADVRASRIERLLHHLERARDLAKALGDDGESVIEALTVAEHRARGLTN